MFSKDADFNTLMAVIKDKDGKECFKITGNYLKQLMAEDLKSG